MVMIDFNKLNIENKKVLSDVETNVKTYKKLGRKPLSEEEKKSEKISIYLTKEDKELINKMAHQSFMKVSDFILKKVFDER